MAVFSTTGNLSTLDGMMTYGNVVTDGYFGIMILVMVFFISFLAMRSRMVGQNVNAKVFVAASFITTVVCTMLFMLSLVNDVTLYLTIAATAIGVFANLMSGPRY